ncbi:MAG: hypothetical protein WC583_00450 [Candidatus Omnitrophota bacterium]|jgi:hypothetical protein|nr:hypothetical protein [Candidatus Omnitrophota bacterium]MDD3982458.1 hypothetical protein [Candidatus Omnitrophota bacterium]MDD5526383.1 hypothetical protein [Candidatus Omnitrophota bacterium]
MKLIRVSLVIAAYFLVFQPCCRADSFNPFSGDKSGNDDSSGSWFIMPVSSRSVRQGKAPVTTPIIYTNPSTIPVYSPQINIQSTPNVFDQTGGMNRTVMDNSAPEINNPDRAASEQPALEIIPSAVDSTEKRETAVSPPEVERSGLVGGEDNSLTELRGSAVKERLPGEAGGEEGFFYAHIAGEDVVREAGGLVSGDSDLDLVFGESRDGDNVRTDMPDDGYPGQDYLAFFTQAGTDEKAALMVETAERGGKDPEEYWIYTQDSGGSDDEEGGYAGYYYNMENSGDGGTARPGEGRLQKKIIKPLKELFYKVSYFSNKEG